MRDVYFGATSFTEEELTDIMQMVSECRIERLHLNHSFSISSISNLYGVFSFPMHLTVLSLDDNRIKPDSLLLLLGATTANQSLSSRLRTLNLSKYVVSFELTAI